MCTSSSSMPLILDWCRQAQHPVNMISSHLTVQESVCGCTVRVNTDICTHTPVCFLYQGHRTCTLTHPLGDLWVSLCFLGMRTVSMSTLFFSWGTLEVWRRVGCGGGGGGGGYPGCPPCVYLGRSQGPAPVRYSNRPRPYCPPPQPSAGSGTYHSGRTGEQQPPHQLNGHTMERGLTWTSVAYSWMLVHVMKRPQCKWCI